MRSAIQVLNYIVHNGSLLAYLYTDHFYAWDNHSFQSIKCKICCQLHTYDLYFLLALLQYVVHLLLPHEDSVLRTLDTCRIWCPSSLEWTYNHICPLVRYVLHCLTQDATPLWQRPFWNMSGLVGDPHYSDLNKYRNVLIKGVQWWSVMCTVITAASTYVTYHQTSEWYKVWYIHEEHADVLLEV